MTLAELITALEAADPDRVVRHGFTNPHSYRGYYHELAFEPAANVTVADMLADARSALGSTYEGYKGGDFTMGEHTDCWLSMEGCASGDTISALLLELMLAEPSPAGAADEAKPEVIVSITRYTVSVLTADNINHRYFALSVELTPRGWIVTDGHSGYDADGTAHHGEARWHPFADYDDALAVARRLAPGLTVNGRTATEVLQRTQETAPTEEATR